MSRVANDAGAGAPVPAEPSPPRRHPPSRIGSLVRRWDGVLVATIALGTVLRFWGLGAQSLWYDEWLTTEAVSGGLADVFRHAANREGIPPPYFLVVGGWVRVFDDTETALRAVSALTGSATVPVAYAIARELGRHRTVARVAALLVAVNPMLVAYSQEARPYGVLALLGALTLLTFARARKRGGRNDYLVWGLVCAAALAVHYFAIFLVVAEGAALLLSRRDRWRELVLAALPSVVVLAVLAPFALEQYSHSPNHRWIADFPLTDRVSEAGRSALVGPSPPDGRLWIPAAIVVAVAALAFARSATREQRSVAALAWGIGGAAVIMPLLAVAVGVDVVLSRYLIAALVPLIVAASITLVVPRARWFTGIAIVALCVISLSSVVAAARDPELQKADWRGVADAFEAASGPRLLVMNTHGNIGAPLLYYLDHARDLGDAETVSVDQIDVVVSEPSAAPCNFLVGRACALVFLGAALPEAVAGEFELAETIELDQFRIDRYRAPEPVPVTKADVVTPIDLPNARVLVAGG